MGIFDRFKQKPAEPAKPFKKRGYAAANAGRLFTDFGTTSASADAELKPALAAIRARSRDLVRNNEYARRYVQLIRNNVVGDRGFRLQVKARDNGVLDLGGNQAVENAWAEWCRTGNCTVDGRLSFLDCQKLVAESLVRDGEVFVLKYKGPYTHGFAFQFIEPDRIDETLNKKLSNGNEIRMGIECDQFRRPVAYYMSAAHPNDIHYGQAFGTKHVRIDADRIIHIYEQSRIGLSRGEPKMAPVIPSLKQLGALTEAQLVACRTGASKMGFFTSPSGDGFVADDYENDVPIYEVSPGLMAQLPAGVTFEKFDPGYPGEFAEFHKSILRGIASGLGVSYVSLASDLEGVSYSSIRSGTIEERENYIALQSFLIDHFCQPIFRAWFENALDNGVLFFPSTRFEKFANSAEFRARRWQWVDPSKEMKANIDGMRAGILSLSQVAAAYGMDVEELFAQMQSDKAMAQQFGINYQLEPYGAAFAPISDSEGGTNE